MAKINLPIKEATCKECGSEIKITIPTNKIGYEFYCKKCDELKEIILVKYDL